MRIGLKARSYGLLLIPSGSYHLGLVALELLLKDRFKLWVILLRLTFLVLSDCHILLKSHKTLLLLHRIFISYVPRVRQHRFVLLSLVVTSLHSILLLNSGALAAINLHLAADWAKYAEVRRLVEAADWGHKETLPL